MRRALISAVVILALGAIVSGFLDWLAWPWVGLGLILLLVVLAMIPLLARRSTRLESVDPPDLVSRSDRDWPAERDALDPADDPLFDKAPSSRPIPWAAPAPTGASPPLSAPLPRARIRSYDPPLPDETFDTLSAGEWSLDGQMAIGKSSRLTMAGGGGGPGGVPVGIREEPLPHDGLFVRRNNAFGTGLALGIGDLINQGILVDQEQIRFDDFLAGNVDDLPAPVDGSAIAVRHGWTAAVGDYKARNDTTHFLEVALRAAQPPAGGSAPRRPVPVNVVFVVDTSGSMDGEKIDSVKKAISGLYTQLRDDDVLGIVAFDTQVRTVMQATRKADLPEEQLTRLVGGLRADGGTDINMGVLFGLDEIARHSGRRADFANYVYLFSDGDPTSGETNWIKIRTNIASRVRGDVTLSCFGFGYDARMRELDALAGLTGGQSAFVTHPDVLRLNLAEDLARREHLAAINIQLRIEIPPEATVWHLYGHDLITDPARRRTVEQEVRDVRHRGREEYGVDALPDLVADDTGIRIFAPDLAFGEAYWVVLEVQVEGDRPMPDLGTVTVQYLDIGARVNRRQRLVLSEDATIPDGVVQAHAVGLWTSEVTFYALTTCMPTTATAPGVGCPTTPTP